jgi:hypothetical protein
MKKLTLLSPGLCLLFLGSTICSAQDNMDPPKVLLIQREFLKPGKAGSSHEKTEAAFVRAMSAAKWPTNYFGMDSMSGASRALFFIGYPSFEAMEKDNLAMQKNPTLAAGIDRATQADGDLLSSYEASIFLYREDMSFHAGTVNIAQMRYFEITQFVIKPGHNKEWEELVKIYTTNYSKAVPDARWATFERYYGTGSGATFIVTTPMKSLSEVDKSFGDSKKFMDSMSGSDKKKMEELEAECIDTEMTNLFAFNPKESYPPQEWIKTDSFWKPKMATPMAAPAAAKPAQ